MTAALIVAAYLLITKLADIGFGTIAHEVSKASPAWVVLGLILAQLALIGSGVSIRGGVADAAPVAPVRPGSVGDQVHQPRRAQLGGPNRDEPPLPPKERRAAG